MTLLLQPDELSSWQERLDRMFLASLPERVQGFPTRYSVFADEPGTTHMAVYGHRHRIEITSLDAFLDRHLGVRAVSELDAATWATLPEQGLLEVTSGVVFHDTVGELTLARRTLAWYPDDIWRYRLAAGWKRIAQREPFIGRAGEVGDDLGSQVIALSLVHDVMRLALLQARRYAPYAKWLGTAFRGLREAERLMPWLDRARYATTWQDREAGLVGALGLLAERHNDLGLTEWLDPAPRPFHDRPFTVLEAERFADALTRAIQDASVRILPTYLGGIDQYIDSTDAILNAGLRRAVRGWLREGR